MTTNVDGVPPAAGEPERLRVGVFGKLTMGIGNDVAKPVGRKAQAMLGYLVLADTTQAAQATRDRLVGLLWSESDEGLARGSLRQSLRELQAALRAIGFGHLDAERHTIAIDRKWLDVDVWNVLDRARRGQLHPILLTRARITDTVLEGLDTVDPAFGEWLRETRAVLHGQLVAGLAQALPGEDASPISEASEAIARAISLLDPGHEASVRLIIRARWAAGDVGSAFKAYERLWQHLEAEFEARPSLETQDLIARLRLEQPEAETPPPSLPLAQERLPGGYEARPSIAVLPFQTLGPPDERYFGDGIVDDIIQNLAVLRELVVIAKGSTRKYRDAAPDVKAIARELGVRYVLHGNVQRLRENVRIHTMLANGDTGEVIQARRYDGLISDLFNLQDEIALETTKNIAPLVRDQELRRAMRKRPQNLNAYDLVLQALGPLHDVDYSTFSRARSLLHKAIELDPTFAPAYSYAAHWHCYRIGQEWSTDVAADAAEAGRLAAIAIGLDGNDATALAVHAHVKCIARDYAASRAGFDRALAASPNSAYAWTLSSVTESCAGNGPDAVVRAQAALRLSPGDNFAHFTESVLGQGHFVSGDYGEATRYGRMAYDRNNKFAGNLRILGASLVETGRLRSAREIVEQHIRIVPSFRLSNWIKRTWLCEPVRNRVAEDLRRAGMPD